MLKELLSSQTGEMSNTFMNDREKILYFKVLEFVIHLIM